jgi:hypothetical protein
LRSLARKVKTVGLALALAGLLAAAVASPASATPVAAKFSSSSLKLTTTGITLKRNGLEPKTCTMDKGAAYGGSESNTWAVYNTEYLPWPTVQFTCGSQGFVMTMGGEAFYDTVPGYYLQLRDMGMGYGGKYTPYGNYIQTFGEGKAVGKWINGSGLTPSTIKFENATVGVLESPASGTVTLSGTFTATTTSNTLLTLSK